MEILTPPRIATLQPRSIRVVQHTSYTESNTLVLENVYPFETLFSLKQRIALAHRDEKQWLPHHLFLAESTAEGGYKPLEFKWPFAATLTDPCDPAIVGTPDARLYENEAKKPIFPKIFSGATVETMVGTGEIIHIWNYTTVAAAAGFGPGVLPPDSSFEGFFQLYFPAIDRRDELVAVFTPISDADKEVFTVAAAYRDAVSDRLQMIEAGMKSPALQSAEPVLLRDLYRARFTLQSKPGEFENGKLELKFYEMEATAAAPFLRFFPASDRSPPLVKLAKTATGTSRIPSTKLLDALMSEQPSTDNGAVILIKVPIQSPGAYEGTAWTLLIMEDGSASLYITAPRKNQPITYRVYEEAVRALPEFLAATPWRDAAGELTLSEIQAVYEFKSGLAGGKPTKAELRARLNAFLPLFLEEKVPTGDSAALALRYKAVNNFKADKNPIMNFITYLYFREPPAAMEALPVPIFIAAIAQEFGIGPTEAADYMRNWITRNAEFIAMEGETAVPAVSLGALVNVYNSHPKYMFDVRNVESQVDLNRVLTLMALFTSVTSESFKAPQVAAEQAADAIQEAEADVPAPENPDAEPAAEANVDLDMELAMMGVLPDETDVIEHVQELAPAPAPPAPVAPPVGPRVRLAEGETLPPLDQWVLNKLKERDNELFGYTKVKGDERVAVYSRACQSSQNKQPNVMAPETYARMRAYYGDRVFWVEVPFEDPKDYAISMYAIRTFKERKRDMAKAGLSIKESVKAEKRALEMGFPLAGDISITSLPDVAAQLTDAEKAEITHLMTVQKSKPLWIVVRLGTKESAPNYYICAELWCVLDDVPIIDSEFVSAGGCPFCGGKEVSDVKSPKPGETVLRRKPTALGDKVAKYAGIQEKELFHPDRFALPCCFTKPDSFKVPAGAQPIPPPAVPLPPLQAAAPPAAPEPVSVVQEEGAAPAAPAEAPANIPMTAPEPPQQAAPATVAPIDAANRARPFAPNSIRGSAQNQWYIPNQNILGRANVSWFELERGAAAVPPPSVNTLLGQDPEKFLTKIKGALSEKINSYLAYPAAAFVRYGISSAKQSPGVNFLSLLSFAEYAVDHYLNTAADTAMRSHEQILTHMLETRAYEMAGAFIQANYGTLVHEFARPDRALSIEEENEFPKWWFRVGNQVPEIAASQNAYGKYVYLAWLNFKNYIRDLQEPKDLRLFEGLFATPNLLTKTGFLIVRILYPKGRDETPTILCPEFGVSFYAQKEKPPLLFLLEDSVTGLYDPLVFYEGLNKETRLLCGVLQPETDAFGAFSPQVREALQGFISQYFSATDGCGRTGSPTHPWVPVADASRVPRLSELVEVYKSKEKPDGFIQSVLRDRSNRAVGVIVMYNKKSYYIPAVDDGTILMYLRSVYGEDAMPRPDLADVLDMYAGRTKAMGKKKLGKLFPGLRPRALVGTPTEYTGIELECNAIVMIKPMSRELKIPHALFDELKKDYVPLEIKDTMPWETNAELLTFPPTGAQTLPPTSEEQLEETYQHVRITISNWLNSSPIGQRVKAQIELLRQARKRLPLYELQKRLDLLLFPVVADIITPEGESKSSLLRRDCLKITSERDCGGGCAWSGGRCLIHTPPSTERYMNPARVLTARLVDELLRTFSAAMEVLQQDGRRVSLLKPLHHDDVIHQGESILFSAEGRGDDFLYEKLGYLGRKPSDYTAGLTYPEEVSADGMDSGPVMLPADWAATLQYAEFGADIARDNYAKQVAAIVGITGKPITDLERDLGAEYRGGAQWAQIAGILGLTVVVTYINPDNRRIEYLTSYAGGGGGAAAPAPRYVILDPTGVPLQKVSDRSYVLTEAELPGSLRAVLG